LAGIFGVEVMVMRGQISGEDVKKGGMDRLAELERQQSVVT